MNTEPFNVPLSLPIHRQSATTSSSIEAAFSLCSPTCLIQYRRLHTDGAPGSPSACSDPCGAALGCEDGSVFVFDARSAASSDDHGLSKAAQQDSKIPFTSQHLRTGRVTPRSTSPSPGKIQFVPFQVSRSRIVSSVSSQQAEAPKIYVDFEEEPEKLKRILKGKTTKDRTPDEPRSPREHDELAEKDTRSRQSSSTVSTANSVSKGRPSSSPPSPHLHNDVSKEVESCPALSLRYHIIPPRSGPSTAISSIKAFGHDRYIVCLQSAGSISVHSTTDGLCLGAIRLEDGDPRQPTKQGTRTRLPIMWDWCRVDVIPCDESNIIVVYASREDSYRASITDNQDPGQQTKIAVFDLSGALDPTGLALIKIGDELLDGLPECIELQRAPHGTPELLRISSSRRLILQPLNRPTGLTDEKRLDESIAAKSLPLPNPFKAFASLSSERVAEDDGETATGVGLLGEEIDMGELPTESPILGLRLHSTGDITRVLVWSSTDISVIEITGTSMRVLSIRAMSGARKAEWITCDSFVVVDSTASTTFGLVEPSTTEDNAASPAEGKLPYDIKLLHSHALPPFDALCLTGTGDVLLTHLKAGYRRLDSLPANPSSKVQTLYKARRIQHSEGEEAYLSSLLPIDMSYMILGFSDGRLGRSSLTTLVTKCAQDAVSDYSDVPLGGSIATIFSVNNEITNEIFLVGGADDGSIAIWALDSLKLCAQWVIFTEPLVDVIHLRDEAAGRMRGCLFCASQDGTVAVINLDGFQFLYILPASAAPLQRICIGGDNLLVIYGDHRARLWDTQTREFWRSMNMEKAEEMLQQGGWAEWSVGLSEHSMNSWMSVVARGSGVDAASTLLLDLEALLRQSAPSQVTTVEACGPTRLAHLQATLSSLLTFGISDGIDQICQERLEAKKSEIFAGCMSHRSSVLYANHPSFNIWTTSSEVSALHSLALLAVLQAIGQHEGLLDDANTVSGFYATSLGETLGPLYVPPSLPLLARTWLLSSAAELRHAARTLFDVGVVKLSDAEVMQLADLWQSQLPSRQSENAQSLSSAMALFICGFIAVEKYTLLPTSALTDVAKSIALYLHDESSPWRALGIELCSRGFAIWQQHVDAVEMLRALFTLATTTRKDSISPHNTGSQARTAVLQIATNNSALFMTTLTIDILHPRSLNHRKSILQLVIFLIRKKPLTLYSNLPRLVEAVVKSLDPNSTASRDAVLDSATEILGHIVRTYPTVDFHMATQRLAVGTSEGAVVMYDLKTATRLYVLEGHRKRTAACSFSPDGRRLVTLSLEESLLLVWKVGSSFSSFFNPGAPPRQGQSGSDPFKTLSFNIGNEAHMTLANTLELVHFEWPADRSVKVKIRQSTLTFST